jgi:hypothetical protein
MKKTLTRALGTKAIERHTIWPKGPRPSLVHRCNMALAGFGVELVSLTPSSPENYTDAVYQSWNRAEDAETMLGTRQLDHMQKCVIDVLENNVPGDLLEAGVWRGGMAIFMRALLKAYGIGDRKIWVVDSFAGLPEIDAHQDTFAWRMGDMAGKKFARSIDSPSVGRNGLELR